MIPKDIFDQLQQSLGFDVQARNATSDIGIPTSMDATDKIPEQL